MFLGLLGTDNLLGLKPGVPSAISILRVKLSILPHVFIGEKPLFELILALIDDFGISGCYQVSLFFLKSSVTEVSLLHERLFAAKSLIFLATLP